MVLFQPGHGGISFILYPAKENYGIRMTMKTRPIEIMEDIVGPKVDPGISSGTCGMAISFS